MKVRAVVGLNVPPDDRRVEPGEDCDLPERIARSLVTQGLAEAIGATEPAVTSTGSPVTPSHRFRRPSPRKE